MTEDNTKSSEVANKDEKGLAKLDEKYLRDNAKVGIEDVNPEDLPTPTIVLIQKNSDLTDEDGRPLPRGQFFYRGNNRLMKEVNCSFLSVTKTELPDFINKDEKVKTFVLLGALEPDWRPFLMYMNKTKMQTVRHFLGQITTAQMPMFAQKVRITAEEVNSPKGDYYVPRLQVLGLRENMDEIVMLEDMAKTYGARLREQVKEVNFTDEE